jgi:hypothetical protein
LAKAKTIHSSILFQLKLEAIEMVAIEIMFIEQSLIELKAI